MEFYNKERKVCCGLCGKTDCSCGVVKTIVLKPFAIAQEQTQWQCAKDALAETDYLPDGTNSSVNSRATEYFSVISQGKFSDRITSCDHLGVTLLNHLKQKAKQFDVAQRRLQRGFLICPYNVISSCMKAKSVFYDCINRKAPEKIEMTVNSTYIIDKFFGELLFEAGGAGDTGECPGVDIFGIRVWTSPDGYFDGKTVEFKTVHIRGKSSVETAERNLNQWFYQLACQQLITASTGALLGIFLVLQQNDLVSGKWVGHTYFKVFELLPENIEKCRDEWEAWVTELERTDARALADLRDYSNGRIVFTDIARVAADQNKERKKQPEKAKTQSVGGFAALGSDDGEEESD